MSAYDMWSVGVVWLELLLGTPHVFQVPFALGKVMAIVATNAPCFDPSCAAAALLVAARPELCCSSPLALPCTR